jgi:uncharacterized membrane protein YkoI
MKRKLPLALNDHIAPGSLAEPLAKKRAGGSILQSARPLILLTWAVFSAEQYALGEARRVELEEKNGHPVYTVTVARSDGMARVHLDPVNGLISTETS